MCIRSSLEQLTLSVTLCLPVIRFPHLKIYFFKHKKQKINNSSNQFFCPCAIKLKSISFQKRTYFIHSNVIQTTLKPPTREHTNIRLTTRMRLEYRYQISKQFSFHK
jgi:hypothetical protein